MTDHSLPDDELLSSSLDGELTDEEAARLEVRLTAEPALAERLDALRAAEAMASTPVTPLAANDAERMIAVALAASTTTADNVTDLAAAAGRRRAWPARMATIAAAVIALAIAVPALRAIDPGSDSDDAGSADTAADAFDGESLVESAGDDSTEADMATEALSVTDDDTADSDMGGSVDDTSDAAQDEGVGSDDAEREFDESVTNLASSILGYSPDGDFDPLPSDLGDFGTVGALSVAASVDWTQYLSDTVTSTTTAPANNSTPTEDPAATIEGAFARLNQLGLGACPDILEGMVGRVDGTPVIALDYATATVAGDPVTVGLFEMSDDRATVVIIDQTTCEIVDVILG